MKNLEEQIDSLVTLGYPALMSCEPTVFRAKLMSLAPHVANHALAESDIAAGTVDYVLVIHTPTAPVDRTLPLLTRQGKSAIQQLFPRRADFFQPLESLRGTLGDAYLLLDVDRGNQTLNMVPLNAQKLLAARGRTPLTVEEGIALLTQFPDQLQPNHCFMMMGSRGDDKRVPALWLSKKQPKLGWCWEGNPHTWLGFASAGGRSPTVRFDGPD
jgi:hypothetical protein